MPHPYRLRLLALLAACLYVGCSMAQPLPPSAGYVAKVVGAAFVTRLGRTTPAALGQTIVEGMTLRTGAAGGLAVILDDGTLMSFGPHSELRLDRYRFAPASERFGLNAHFSRGTLSLATGALARLDPEAIRLTTPHGRIEVHAGHALLKVAR